MLRLRKTRLFTLSGTQSLNFKSHNNFNDLLKQPIYSFTQNSFINFDLEAIKQLQANFGLDWTTSIILASGGIRLFLTGSNYLISKLNLKHPEERKTWKEFQEKVFFNDLEKTEKFILFCKDSEPSSIEQKKRWYSLNNLVSVGWSGFILVNWFRSLHFLCFNTHFFQNLSTEHILGVFPLASYDPYFIMPVITFLFNYFAISGSKHPFLSIFNQEQNLIRRFNKIFLLSLPAIFFPSAYLISWCSFLATHMALRKLQQVAHDRKQNATLNKYVLTPKKIRQIEEYYNRVVLKGKSKND